MISVREAWTILASSIRPLPAINLPLDDCLGYVLAAPALADTDQPPFDRSSIDGFACRLGAEEETFRVVGEILPGSPPPPLIAPGEAWRVFTGSALPPGTALVMVEDVLDQGQTVQFRIQPDPRLVRVRGSTARAGDCLLPSDTPLGPGELALLASAGIVDPWVIPKPRVLHITTGREIVPPSVQPQPGQIRNTNRVLIHHLLTLAGAGPLPGCHVDEAVESLVAAVQAAPAHDVLLVSGGSSVGAHDRTPEALKALGYDLRIRAVAVRPGKPLLFAVRGEQIAFGLPGNPVSHLATFHLFVRPALRRLAGLPPIAPFQARLKTGAPLRPDRRETFWPCSLGWDDCSLTACPRPWLDSGDLTALAQVDGLLRLPSDQAVPKEGDTVEVIPARPIELWHGAKLG
ncbi:MAG: molybdopterin-binding protein [Candidatus Methylacidiphilales bacterium]